MISSKLPVPNAVPNATSQPDRAGLREQILAAPQVPGVYIFHGEARGYPLYIGKSINLRVRLLSHLRNPKETRLLQQTARISYIRTAGEISALLLEAQLIKQQQPLLNRRLRKTKDTCSLVLKPTGLSIEYAGSRIDNADHRVFGLFKNQFAAKERLRNLADEHRLCLSLLGFEPDTKGHPCFRAAIQKCAGACCGQEDPATHHHRLQAALQDYAIAAWPYQGAIALKERFGRLTQYHVLQHWRYHGSYQSLRGLQQYKLNTHAVFDADMYRILARPILHETAEIIELHKNM